METITIRVHAFNREGAQMIHCAQKSYKNVLEERSNVQHINGFVAQKRFTLFMFIYATPVALFVLNIDYELISGYATGYC